MRRIGWLYCAIGLTWTANAFSGVYALVALLGAPGSLPAGLAFAWIQTWFWLVVIGLLLVFLPLLYPTGRLLSRRWQPLVVFAIGLLGGGIVLEAVAPGPLGNHLLDFQVSIANPLGLAAVGPAHPVIAPIAVLLLFLLTLLAAFSLVVRLRRSRGDERQQLKGFVYVASLLVALFVTDNLLYLLFPRHPVTLAVEAASYPVGSLALALLPLLTGLAILKYRLYDIDRLINRTLVYGALTACVVGFYVLLVGGLGALLQAQGNLLLGLLATGLGTVLFQPLRRRLQQGVNRLLYGERDDPYAIVARVNKQLTTALTSDTLLLAIVRSVREGLKLSYVAIALRQEQEHIVVAAAGKATGEQLRLPLLYQNEPVGDLLVAARGAGETFSALDHRLLDDLCAPVGVAVHAVRLTTDLQRSREQLVTAREEERRRLRRDLHDGLGPALGGLTLKLDALGDELRYDPTQAATLLSELKGDVQAAVADVRRLVYALRPPALDELGLVGALRLLVTHYQRPNLQVDVDAPKDLPPLLAAVEVAVYRIAQEALTNVIRHAQASACVVSLAVRDGLELTIKDNGRGAPAQQPLGVGLLSMRERATELGGECTFASVSGEGALVRAWLPLPGTPQPPPALPRSGALQPDVVLMDLRMPGVNGIEATRHILQTSPHMRVLVLTMYEDDDSVFAALRAGARGYVLKGADKAEILRAIRAVASGEAIFGPAIAQRLIRYFALLRPPMAPIAFPELTEREREILARIAQGWSNEEIATSLLISLKTVRNHVSNIFSKLQVVDRTQAIIQARKAGLGNDAPDA